MISSILFLDLEVTRKGKIADIGLLFDQDALHTDSLEEAAEFIERYAQQIRFACGHNLIDFDLSHIEGTSLAPLFEKYLFIDTLPISLLLFNEKTFHSLPKAYKREDDFRNNPLEDARLSAELYRRAVERFSGLDPQMQEFLFALTHRERKFSAFYESLSQKPRTIDTILLLSKLNERYGDLVTDLRALKEAIESRPVELAYILSLSTDLIEVKAYPPKILFDYPRIVQLHESLMLSDHTESEVAEFSKEVFGFAGFREFPRLDPTLEGGALISQREIVEAALKKESFIAVLPTGGGKTFTFWLPALFRAQRIKALTVVISPLQALMRDHIESFERQVANYTAVALSGYQTPLERADTIDKVVNGEADILYLAPESLRSNTVFAMLKNRLIDRFVIDEAHCLSTWGHDFRHDYFYIAEFIKDLLEEQPWQEKIPVSCFTATAKPDVIKDIARYFSDGLQLSLSRYLAHPERTNLTYESLEVEKEEQKYLKLLEILDERQGAALVYIPSSTRKCDEIAERLKADLAPRNAASFHAKLESEQKMEILRGYLQGEIDIVVATTAFGMGVDKPDIRTVIHYEISDSLENYAQEAGRGARDKSLEALCPILFDEKDLDKHFATLNRMRLSDSEVNAVFRVLKAQKGKKILMSAREIAEAAGWDTEGADDSWEIKVKTALLELEREGYLSRKRNRVRYYADAVAKDAFERLQALRDSKTIDEERYNQLHKVLNALLGRGKPATFELDEAALYLDMSREKIAEAIVALKGYDIVNDAKEMTLRIAPDAEERLQWILAIEQALYRHLREERSGTTTLRALNESLIERGILSPTENGTETIRELLKGWRAKSEIFRFYRIDRINDLWRYELYDDRALKKALILKHTIAEKLVRQLLSSQADRRGKEPLEVRFSISQLREVLGFPVRAIDRALLYLHRSKILELGEGRFIYYAPMQIYKTEKFSTKRRYTKAEYAKRLKAYYTRKTEAIHIMGEYARRMRRNPAEAKAFLSDYFTVSYDRFKRRYKLLKEEITRPMTKRRYEKIFGSLSDAQKRIIEDNEHDAIMVLAGPGSGKTKVLVHKMASLILKEDIQPDQFLMLTFSHAAASEFRSRLFELIGEVAREVEIRTFHGFALKLIGRQVVDGDQTLLKNAISEAARQIREEQVHPPFKSVLMLDEFQDINADAFELIEALYDRQGGGMRVIAVGDDDQCILQSVNGADLSFFDRFSRSFGEGEGGYAEYLLVENYRSSPEILKCSQMILDRLHTRKKTDPLQAMNQSTGAVEIVEVHTPHLSTAAVEIFRESIDSEAKTAFLAHSNKEVAEVYSLLHLQGFHPAYLMDRSGYRLKNLAEIHDFNLSLQSFAGDEPIFDDIDMRQAMAQIRQRYGESARLLLLEKVLQTFRKEYDSYYFTLWKNYLEEIDFDEFEDFGNLVVSTMHKSKGREFDHVVVLIPQRKEGDDEWLRLLYVAFTRAKSRLSIVTNDRELVARLQSANRLLHKYVRHRRIERSFERPDTQTYLMSLRDVALGFSYYSSLSPGKRPVAGKFLSLDTSAFPYHLIDEGRKVERLSKGFSSYLKERFQSGWWLDSIEIDAVVYWYDRERERELPHLLGKVVLRSR